MSGKQVVQRLWYVGTANEILYSGVLWMRASYCWRQLRLPFCRRYTTGQPPPAAIYGWSFQ